MALTKDDILKGLSDLGVTEGMIVMAHSSLSALGEVEGGADTLIEVLAEAVGPTGTLCMPAMSGERPFRVESSPSNVGIVTERFRSWPGVVRSIHPTHSVSCLGPKSEQIIAGHIDQPTALGPESPWGRIAQMDNGYILLLGCDQDRSTLLHCAEEAVDAPYLTDIQPEYVDADGQVKTKVLHKFPGPHRDFIGLDSLFREAGIMKTGKIGRAVCRLMNAGETLELAVAALHRDPAAVLCNNPNCGDCVKQRAAIARTRLSCEDFTLSAVADELAVPLSGLVDGLPLLGGQAVDTIELGPALSAALIAAGDAELSGIGRTLEAAGAKVAMVSCPVDTSPIADSVRNAAAVATALGARLVKLPPLSPDMSERVARIPELVRETAQSGVSLVVENQQGTVCDTKEKCEEFLAINPGVGLAFNPAGFAHVGEHPFLKTFYKGRLKQYIVQLYITDGCHPDGEPYVLPGQGNGEVKELMSILRCRGFDGYFCLKMGDRTGKEAFARHAKAFWHLMATL